MKKFTHILLLYVLSTSWATGQTDALFPLGEKAPNVHHTGDVWLFHPSDADDYFDYSLTVAAFAPGAKLDWHLHPAGQQLVITEGVGYYQERGQVVQIVRKGDVIKCTPGIEHWHAATPEYGVTYLAVTGNERTQWKEKVTEEDYQNAVGSALERQEIELLKLSLDKWRWMADKNVELLADLFHDQAKFVHMGGSWGKEQEVDIIRSGRIHYKQADVHEASVQVFDDTAILLNRITLLAVVGGNEVTNPFEVTEVYKKNAGEWKLASLSFTKLLERE